LILVVWSASTITFFIPRLSPRNAIRERFAELSRMGGFAPADLEKIIASYNKQFGLDKPLLQQYWDYLWGVVHLDFGYSLNKYPTTFILLPGVPPVLMGVLLLFFIGFRLKLLPLGGAYSIGTIPNWSWDFAL